MKTYLLEIIPKIKQFSKTLDELTLLTDKQWVLIGEEEGPKISYIFRSNNQLLISVAGSIEKGTWEYLGGNVMLIENSSGNFLFKQGFFNEQVLALKVDGKEEYAVFVTDSLYERAFHSIEKVSSFLHEGYLDSTTWETKIKEIQEHPYEVPPYRIVSDTIQNRFLNGKRRKIHVSFEDGVAGVIFQEINGNDFYLALGVERHHYQDFDSCLACLHSHRVKGKILEKGKISSSTW